MAMRMRRGRIIRRWRRRRRRRRKMRRGSR